MVRLGAIPANQRHCCSISPSFQYRMGSISNSTPSPFPHTKISTSIWTNLEYLISHSKICFAKGFAESSNFPQFHLSTPKSVLLETFLGCFIFFYAKENSITCLIGCFSLQRSSKSLGTTNKFFALGHCIVWGKGGGATLPRFFCHFSPSNSA